MASAPLTPEQMTELIRAMEEAKAGYAPPRNVSEYQVHFYLGIMHGMEHAIDILRRASSETAWRGDG
jgi:hypothetical protein